MPELPEVETIRLGLEKYLKSARLEAVEVRLPKMFSGDPKLIEGLSVVGVRRFGKGLVIDFERDYCLAVHVKMTGQLIYVGKGEKGSYDRQKVGGELPNKHTHVMLKFKDKSEKLKIDQEKGTLYYNDIRQFGWMKIVKSEKLKDESFFGSLGPEPLKDLTLEVFERILKSSGTPIKTLLMDQKRIAGVGNIYANDALFLAKIHPKRKANSLKEKESEALFNSLEKVLRKGLEVGGASEWQFVNADGQTGGYQNFFQIYGKVGKPCPNCGTKIEKVTLGGRGTFFCPECQI